MDIERLDSIIQQLLDAGSKDDQKSIVLQISEILYLCDKATEVFLSQPCLLELKAPIKICGDIFVKYCDLLQIFDHAGFPPKSNYLFLGNYIFDKAQAFQTLCLLLAYKIKYPGNLFLLRGEYDESERIQSLVLFYDSCTKYENSLLPISLSRCFNCMPMAAIIDKKMFCVHGGISPWLYDLEKIRNIQRPAKMQDHSLIHDLVAAEPDFAIQGWGKSSAGGQTTFGPNKLFKFLNKNDLDIFCRGQHFLAFEDSTYEFSVDGQLVTIFSTAYPCYSKNSKIAGVIIDIYGTFRFNFLIFSQSTNETGTNETGTDDIHTNNTETNETDTKDTWLTRMVKLIRRQPKDTATKVQPTIHLSQNATKIPLTIPFQRHQANATEILPIIMIGCKKKFEATFVTQDLKVAKLERPTAVVAKPNLELAPETSKTDTVVKDLKESWHSANYSMLQRELDDARKEDEALKLKIQQLTTNTSESSSSNIPYAELQEATDNLEAVANEELGFTKLEKTIDVPTQLNLELATENSQLDTIAKDINDSYSHRVDYGILQQERDDALREAEALRLEIQHLTSRTSESSSSNISYDELQEATKNFDISMKIGKGGFAIVYKGFLRGTNVAIKTLRPEKLIEQSGFDKEATVLSKVRHPNLVTLIGYCSQPFVLVYEYLSNGSLEDRLACKDGSSPLSWQVRTRIIAEIRSALIFLHSNKPYPIVHGDLKPDNIFLDANMVSKLGDFGICSFLNSSNTNSFYHLRNHAKGTYGYIDPVYIRTGRLTKQSDVYSFGIIILRLVTGRPVIGIVEEAEDAISNWNPYSIIDPSAGEWPTTQAKELIKLGIKCCDIDQKKRPKLSGTEWRAVEATITNSSINI